MLQSITSAMKRAAYLMQGIHAYPVKMGENLRLDTFWLVPTSPTDPKTRMFNLRRNFLRLPGDALEYARYQLLRWHQRENFRQLCADEIFNPKKDGKMTAEKLTNMGPLMLSLVVSAANNFLHGRMNEENSMNQMGEIPPALFLAMEQRADHLLRCAREYLDATSPKLTSIYQGNMVFGLLATIFNAGYFDAQEQAVRPFGVTMAMRLEHLSVNERIQILEEACSKIDQMRQSGKILVLN